MIILVWFYETASVGQFVQSRLTVEIVRDKSRFSFWDRHCPNHFYHIGTERLNQALYISKLLLLFPSLMNS